MDFGFYPPEVNSGRMYTGPGSGPLLAAAQAWAALADELYAAATGYQSSVSELTSGTWAGPSSAAMTAAAGSYVAWLSATAMQAETTATQSRAAAAAYEAAFMSTVPPPVIAANRSALAALVATNFLGQNTPAIAATEAAYAAMWAQDAAAMYGYAAAAASATALKPFTSPQPNTDPGGSGGQAAAVGDAASTSAGNAQSLVASIPQTFSAVPTALQNLATAVPAASSSTVTPLDLVADLINLLIGTPTQLSLFGVVVPLSILGGPVDLPYAIATNQVSIHEDRIASGWDGVQPYPGEAEVPPTAFPAYIGNSGQVAAGLGEANTVGGLSVPSGWTTAAPEVRSVALASPLGNASATVGPAMEAGVANTVNQMGIGGMAGQAMAGPPAPAATEENGKATTHTRLTPGVTGLVSGGEPEAKPAPRTVVTGVAAAIREIARQRAEGRLSELEYTEQKKRLLDISSGHRPLA